MVFGQPFIGPSNVWDKLFSFRLHPFGRPTIRGDKVTAGLRGWSKVQAAAILAGQQCSLCVTWIFLYLVKLVFGIFVLFNFCIYGNKVTAGLVKSAHHSNSRSPLVNGVLLFRTLH